MIDLCLTALFLFNQSMAACFTLRLSSEHKHSSDRVAVIIIISVVDVIADPLHTRVGTVVPQWDVAGLKSTNSSGMFLISTFHFSSETRLLALEMYGHTAGNVKVFVSIITAIIHLFTR